MIRELLPFHGSCDELLDFFGSRIDPDPDSGSSHLLTVIHKISLTLSEIWSRLTRLGTFLFCILRLLINFHLILELYFPRTWSCNTGVVPFVGFVDVIEEEDQRPPITHGGKVKDALCKRNHDINILVVLFSVVYFTRFLYLSIPLPLQTWFRLRLDFTEQYLVLCIHFEVNFSFSLLDYGQGVVLFAKEKQWDLSVLHVHFGLKYPYLLHL